MCNLYDLGKSRQASLDDWENAIARVISDSEEALQRQQAGETVTSPKQFGIRKTDPGLVLNLENGNPTPQVMRWGFHRHFNLAINNARSEKLDGVWAAPWQAKQRCLIPMSAFYEWQGAAGAKQTFAIRPSQTTFVWTAGIWEKVEAPPNELPFRYSMLTTAASGQMEEIHDRMPVMLLPDQFVDFLEADDPRELLTKAETELEIFRCENPLKNPASHQGPVKETFLPGFE